MLQREDFAERMKEGAAIGAHEILYPFNQAYDSVAVRADVEIGGTDQLFNLLFGREIQKAYGQEPQDVAVFPLLEGLDGVSRRCPSRSATTSALTEPPEQIYGKTMSIPDRAHREVRAAVSGSTANRDGRSARAEAARRKGRAGAQARRAACMGRRPPRAPKKDFETQVPAPRDARRRAGAQSSADLDGPGGLAPGSRPGAKPRAMRARLIEQGGVRVNGEKIGLDWKLRDGDVVQAGKRNFVRIRKR